MTCQEAPAICSSISQHSQKTHRFFVNDSLVPAVFCRRAVLVQLGRLEEKFRRDLICVEKPEGQEGVSSETSAFQWEED